MSGYSKAPLGVKEPKAQKQPFGISAGMNKEFVRTRSVPKPVYNDFGRYCVGSSGAVSSISQNKE